MTYCDAVLNFARPVFYFGIVYGVHRYLVDYQPDIPYTWGIGVLVMMTWYVFLKCVFNCLGLTGLGSFDELYIYEQANNKTIIPAILYFDKFDGDTMLTHFKNNTLKYQRLRSTFVKVLDQWYLKEIDYDTLMKSVEDNFVKVEQTSLGNPIDSDAALAEFYTTEMNIPFEEGKLFFKVFVVENFSETQSVVLFKCHHAIADGMSLIGLLCSMQDQYDNE